MLARLLQVLELLNLLRIEVFLWNGRTLFNLRSVLRYRKAEKT